MRISWRVLDKLRYLPEEDLYLWEGTDQKYRQASSPCLFCRKEFFINAEDKSVMSSLYCCPVCMEKHLPFLELSIEYIERLKKEKEPYPKSYLRMKGRPTRAVRHFIDRIRNSEEA